MLILRVLGAFLIAEFRYEKWSVPRRVMGAAWRHSKSDRTGLRKRLPEKW
jgi:hypothetical protein